MNLVKLLEDMYVQFTSDEILLRFLHYFPNNQNDKPLDKNKPNILELPIEEKFAIINEVIYARDKKFELDVESNFARINFYLGERKPYSNYSKASRKLTSNPFISRQEVIIDIYANMHMDNTDMRLARLIERVNFLVNGKNFSQFLGFQYDFGYTISKTADDFVGYRLIYYTLSPQQSPCKDSDWEW